MIASLGAAIDAALAARARLRDRPVRDTAAALAAAATRWRDDPALLADLPAAANLAPGMVRAVLPLAAEALDADALVDLHAREAEAGDGPRLVAVVLPSNVPGLALPAVAHACLAGAAVLIKSGRADTLSAPAFRRALDVVDPALAATVVPAYWPGGAASVEDALLSRADVVVAMGSDATVGALARRLDVRLLADGSRTSVAVLAPDPADDDVTGLAWDVARYEQRGCLSPHTVFVLGEPLRAAERLLGALDMVARDVAAPPASLSERAAHRLALEEARFGGATVLEGAGGTVIVDPDGRLADGPGRRTVRVHTLADAALLPDRLPAGTVECVGVGRGVSVDGEALRARGVARVCPLGRMQRPRIDWPRGQRPALASLFRGGHEPRIQVEP